MRDDSKEMGDYLRQFRRGGAESRPARIISRRADGDYMVMLLDANNNVVPASRGHLGTELTPGSTVMVINTTASGRSRGSGYVIISPGGPASARGTSKSAPVLLRRGRTGTALLSVEPSPLTIAQGGSGVLTVFGVGFSAGSVVTFDVAGLSVSGIASGDQWIEITIAAAGDCTIGRAKVTVDGNALGDVIDVAAASTPAIVAFERMDGSPITAADPLVWPAPWNPIFLRMMLTGHVDGEYNGIGVTSYPIFAGSGVFVFTYPPYPLVAGLITVELNSLATDPIVNTLCQVTLLDDNPGYGVTLIVAVYPDLILLTV